LEALVMDWVDGVIPDAQGEAAARAAGRTDLIALVAAMKADKAVLASMARIEPPRFDLADVMSRLERAEGDEASTRSIESHRHRRAWKVPAWPLAMAAGLVVAAMVATQVGRVSNPPTAGFSPKSAPAPIAMNDAAHQAAEIARVAAAPASEQGALAMQPLAGAVHELDATAASIPARLVIGEDRAMELAREGRLLVRVAAVGEEPTFPPLETMLASDASWRVSDDVSRELLAAVRPFFGADAGVKPEVAVGPPEERFLSADMFGPAELESFAATHVPRTAVGVSPTATYVVRLDDDRRVLDQLRRTITTRAAANVLFEEIPGDVRSTSGEEPLDARALVPGRRGLTVPVIVERR
jgi:hypothetical protein